MSETKATEATTTETKAPSIVRIFEGKLHRAQCGHSKTIREGAPLPPPEPVRRPARVAVMLRATEEPAKVLTKRFAKKVH